MLIQRRQVTWAFCGTVLASGLPSAAQAGEPSSAISPPEDLMREHGVLNRVLLLYEAAVAKFGRGENFDVMVVSRGAEIIRDFIEGYHERNEEQQLFPRFRRAGELLDLVDVLYQQHQAGRRLTDSILMLVPDSRNPGQPRQQLVDRLRSFIAMYRPHEAREDTVLFPKLRSIVSANEMAALAEDFERQERRKFGEDGFEMMVAHVAGLERSMGTYDLAAATAAAQ
jgi:hemerythrin-like domain-containing protein